VLATWKANNLDERLRPNFNRINEGDITPAKMPISWITHTINNCGAPTTQAQVSQAIAGMLAKTVYNGQDLKTEVLNNLRAGLASTYIEQSITAANQLAARAPAVDSALLSERRVRPNVFMYPPPPEGGGGDDHKNACAWSYLALFGAGLALATITVMTMGTDAILIGAAWSSLLMWGGIGTAGWSVAQDMICGM
jgi:hypothetical protein